MGRKEGQGEGWVVCGAIAGGIVAAATTLLDVMWLRPESCWPKWVCLFVKEGQRSEGKEGGMGREGQGEGWVGRGKGRDG